MAVWLQVKVRGRGLGLRHIGCTHAVSVTQKAPLWRYPGTGYGTVVASLQYRSGINADCMRRTRAAYHYLLF